ncbi:MAG: hypothetical protein AB7U82_09905 [Blastocatellales bacterium]
MMYVAARIPLAGLASHRAGAVHLTEPEAALCPPDAADVAGAVVEGAAESCPTAIVDDPGVAEAVAVAGAVDCSGWTSFGADAHAEKIASVEKEIIEMHL